MKHRRKKFEVHTCICPNCNKSMYVPRTVGSFRAEGHQKKIWCPFCKREINFTETFGWKEGSVKTMSGEIW